MALLLSPLILRNQDHFSRFAFFFFRAEIRASSLQCRSLASERVQTDGGRNPWLLASSPRDHFAIVAHPPIVCLKSHAETPDGLSIIGAVDKETEIKESIEKRDRKQTSIAHREKKRAGNERIIGTAGTRDRR